MDKEKPVIYVVSDSVGETAEFVVKAVASQFNSGQVSIHRIPFVEDVETLRDIVDEASRYNSVIAYTLVLSELREEIEKYARERNVTIVDVMGPMLNAFAKVMNISPKMEPGLVRKLDEQYFRRVAA
ncbi:MAG TPA: kinase/pyrophosphorylase, partial [Firmicutes bacterium]|nr:kinase/pyrophosphorylase [Bacillota bacterium]